MGPACLNGELRLLKHMFSKGVEWERCKNNPAKKVKLLKGEKRRVRFISQEEAKTLLSNCARHLKPIVTVVLNTGMRKGEILTLKWNQVDFEQGIISLTEANTKNSEPRYIPMNETVRATLKAIPRRGDYVFTNGNGKRFTSLQHSFESAREKSGIEDFHFHNLRHTFASWLVMGGIDIMTVKELLGHQNLEMTLRYAHLSPTHKTKAVNILDNLEKAEPRTQKVSQDEVGLGKSLEYLWN